MKQIDYKLFFIVLPLVIFGMIMISSVSVYSSFRVTSLMESSGLIEEAYNHFYVIRNIAHVFIAFFVLAVISKIRYNIFEKYSKVFIGVSTVLLLIVLLIGPSWNGARGWINLPFLPFAIQPTEFLKFSLIIFFAAFLKQNYSRIKSFKETFLPYFGILAFFVFLVGLQPDFGTVMVIVPMSIIMFFVAGGNVKHLAIVGIVGVFLSFSVYFAGTYDKTIPDSRNKFSYITDRIDNFLSDNKKAIENKTINYQTEQALIAIGSGGFNGLGFGQSIQKYGYLPEVQGDFIFSVIVEELGFLGAFILIGMYLGIGYRGFSIAYYANDLFARFAAIGVTSWILLQAFINIGVNLNIVPLTGITLPFVSYGGSSLLSLMLGVGLLLTISRDSDPSVSTKIRRKSGFGRNQIMFKG